MTALVATLTSLPFTQFRKHKHFYLWYDGFFAVVAALAIAGLRAVHHEPLIATWDNRYWLFFPVAIYLQILCSVWIHNATHNNFPRAVNRVVGEILGLIVLTRFASWEVIHQRHHRYTDDLVRDPHPVQPSYWKFTWHMLVNVERQLQMAYYDAWGDTPGNRRRETARAVVSFTTMLLLITAWYTLLGYYVFWCFFFPASIIGVLHLAHFNWSTHNGFSPIKDFRPVNLNHGFYRVGNVIWHGLYFHANHHKKANLFNPRRMKDSLPVEPSNPGAQVAAG